MHGGCTSNTCGARKARLPTRQWPTKERVFGPSSVQRLRFPRNLARSGWKPCRGGVRGVDKNDRRGCGISQDVLNLEFQNGLTYEESIVMALQLRETAICRVCRHECADRPLINGTGICVSLEEVWGDKRFQYKPSSEIHTVENGLRRDRSEDTMRRVEGDGSE